jgi:hypothetical protein
MENKYNIPKYYIPRVEEFYVGFEYEIKTPNMTEFVETIYSEDDFNEGAFREGCEFRVKYLDEKDVECFQFKPILTKSIGKFHAERKPYDETKELLLLEYDYISHLMTIKTPNYIRDGSGNFDGYIYYAYRLLINNKSEFRKLLIMLRVFGRNNKIEY